MKEFTIYKRSTGQVLYSGRGDNPESIAAQDVSLGIIVGQRFDGGWIENGAHRLPPPQPSPFHDFDWTGRRWLLDVGRAWDAVRAERNRRITASDWVMLPDVQMSEERRAAWTSYRQALRDVTSQPDPLNIAWPVAPT